MIYVASPYSGTPDQQFGRFLAVREYTAQLIADGYCAFSPIVYAHELAQQHEHKTDAQSWERFNTEIIRHCQRMIVLQLPGWAESKGVTAEIALGRLLNLPIQFVEAKFREDY